MAPATRPVDPLRLLSIRAAGLSNKKPGRVRLHSAGFAIRSTPRTGDQVRLARGFIASESWYGTAQCLLIPTIIVRRSVVKMRLSSSRSAMPWVRPAAALLQQAGLPEPVDEQQMQ
jgi:hypothetical protein